MFQSEEVSVRTDQPELRVHTEPGWKRANSEVTIAGVAGDVAICYNSDGTPVATIDRAGRLGVYGLYVVEGPRLSATTKEGDLS